MLTVTMTCTRCEASFPVALDVYRTLQYDTLPKRCPKCCDELQNRPDVVLERTTLAEYTVRVHESFARLFSRAVDFQPLPTDDLSHRLVVKGADYGVSWSGRIDMWSHVWPVMAGDVVTFAHTSCRRKVWYVERHRQIAGMVAPGSARIVTTSRRVPPDYQPQEYQFHGETLREVGPLQREEVNEYVVLTQTLGSTAAALQRDALPALCWLEAYSKATLKGFGAQYSREIRGTPLWSLEVSGGARSGRLGTRAMLAVVDPLDPLRIIGHGDYADDHTIP